MTKTTKASAPESRPGPLSGIRVLDLTRYVSGPFCTLLLAQMGAEVIKVELPPQGDEYRESGPHFLGDQGTLFLSLNANKKSLALNFKHPKGVQVLRRILARADIVVENAKPGSLARRGLDYRTLRESNVGLVYCSITGFGQTGPRRQDGGFDLIAQGLAGVMSVTGEADGAPVKVGLPVLDLGAGMFAALGILGALLARQRTGEGQYVETSLFDCALAWQCMGITTFYAGGGVPGRHGSASPYFAPYEAYRTRDGYITIAGAPSQKLWMRFCHAIGAQHLTDNPSFNTNTNRVANRRDLAHDIEGILKDRDSDYWLTCLSEAGVPAGPIRSLDQVLEDPQVWARELVVKLKTAKDEEVSCIGAPVKLSGTPWQVEAHPPELGQHTVQVLALLGFEEDEILALSKEGILTPGT